MDPDSAGSVFADHVAGELKAERDRRGVLDQRGISVVTSSSTLVTLLSSLVAIAGIRGGSPRPGIATIIALAASLLSFVVAASYGLAANRSQPYSVLDEGSLRSFRDEGRWDIPAGEARWLIYGENVKLIEMFRNGNNRKSRLVNRALGAQLSALFFLALTILIGVADLAR